MQFDISPMNLHEICLLISSTNWKKNLLYKIQWRIFKPKRSAAENEERKTDKFLGERVQAVIATANQAANKYPFKKFYVSI